MFIHSDLAFLIFLVPCMPNAFFKLGEKMGKVLSYTYTTFQWFGTGFIVYEMEASRPKERSLLQVEDPSNYVLIQIIEFVIYQYINKVKSPT